MSEDLSEKLDPEVLLEARRSSLEAALGHLPELHTGESATQRRHRVTRDAEAWLNFVLRGEVAEAS